MKKLRNILLTGLLLLLLPLAALSGVNTWTGTGPFATGAGNRVINALAVTPNGMTVYAGTGSGTVLAYETPASVPVISGINPTNGAAAGGTSVTISGSNLGSASVTVGGSTAAITANTATSITVTTPAQSASSVAGNNLVVTVAGLSATSTFAYTVPSVSSVNPSTGVASGGYSVTLGGLNFSGATGVTIGGVAATIGTVSDTSITVTVPASGTLGVKSVVVTTPAGTGTASNAFTYVGPTPIVTSISPNSGTLAGGTNVTISGSNFTGAIAVTIDGVAATSVVVVNDSSITATTPAGGNVGAKNVLVTTPAGSGIGTSIYLYVPASQTVSFTPTSPVNLGIGPITLTASATSGLTSFTFSTSSAASICTVSGSTLTIVGAGTCALTAAQAGNASYASASSNANVVINALPPAISSISPNIGATTGGYNVVITGTSLSGATAVTIGGAACTPLSANTATSVTCTAPGGTGLGKNVVVTTLGGGSSAEPLNFRYAGPSIDSFTPSSGSTAGGTSITITGINLRSVTGITVGGSACTSPSSNTDTSVSCTTPTGSVGNASVVLTTASGSTTAANSFTYIGQVQTITFAPASPVTVGVSAITLTASSTSGLSAFTFSTSSASTICTVSGSTLTIVGAGTCALTATQAGNASYASASTNANVVINALPPAISGISPGIGATTGGYSVVISGTNFSSATAVTIGGVACTPLSANTATSVTCTAPAGTGLNKDVVVTTSAGDSNSGSFSYGSPTVSAINPSSGSPAGGTSITITGSNLRSVTSITVRGSACTPTANSDASVTCTTPPGTAGTASVVVATASGTTTATNSFTYGLAQIITFTNPGTRTQGMGPIALTASGGASGNTVTFTSLTTGICTVSGSEATLVAPGTCTIAANQAGNSQYVAAEQVTQSFTGLPINSLSLTTGWNLVGNGVNAPIAVASTFNDTTTVMTVWKWVAAGSAAGITYPTWAFYTPALADGGAAYAQRKGYESLSSIEAGEGYWLHAKTAFTLNFNSGDVVMPTVFRSAPGGWHLISTGSTSTPSAFNLDLSTVPPGAGVVPQNITSLWAWESLLGKWFFYAASLEAQGGTALTDYIASKGYLDFSGSGKTLGGGVGFWVKKP